MARNIAVGIDVGTYGVRAIVTEIVKTKEKERQGPRVLGIGYAESKGLRHGYVTNIDDAARAIKLAVRAAEKSSGIDIKQAFLSIGGVGLAGVTCQGGVVITRADSEVSEIDVSKVLEVCENEIPNTYSLNRKIIHSIPLAFKIDGRQVLGRPQGMRGNKLEVKTLFITCLEQHLSDLVQAVNDAGVEVDDVIASPLAASLVSLTKAQKIAGCILANIGAETVSITVFENNIPISLEIFPLGSIDITHDIALGFKLPLEEAEKLKLGHVIEGNHSKKKLEEIVSARLYDVFELIDNHLKKIGRSELLPAGIILMGGGSAASDIEDIARDALKLPSKKGTIISIEKTTKLPFDDTLWTVAYGASVLGLTQGEEPPIGIRLANKTKNKIIAWIKQFLP
jgi:cell division protein FtsA